MNIHVKRARIFTEIKIHVYPWKNVEFCFASSFYHMSIFNAIDYREKNDIIFRKESPVSAYYLKAEKGTPKSRMKIVLQIGSP